MVSLVGPCQAMGSHSDFETLRDGILLRSHVLGRIHQMPHLSNHQNVLLTMCFRYVLTMVSRPGPKIEIWIRMGVANQRSYRTSNGNFENQKPYIFIWKVHLPFVPMPHGRGGPWKYMRAQLGYLDLVLVSPCGPPMAILALRNNCEREVVALCITAQYLTAFQHQNA